MILYQKPCCSAQNKMLFGLKQISMFLPSQHRLQCFLTGKVNKNQNKSTKTLKQTKLIEARFLSQTTLTSILLSFQSQAVFKSNRHLLLINDPPRFVYQIFGRVFDQGFRPQHTVLQVLRDRKIQFRRFYADEHI